MGCDPNFIYYLFPYDSFSGAKNMTEQQQKISSFNVKLSILVFLSFVYIRLVFVAFITAIVMEARRLKICTET